MHHLIPEDYFERLKTFICQKTDNKITKFCKIPSRANSSPPYTFQSLINVDPRLFIIQNFFRIFKQIEQEKQQKLYDFFRKQNTLCLLFLTNNEYDYFFAFCLQYDKIIFNIFGKIGCLNVYSSLHV